MEEMIFNKRAIDLTAGELADVIIAKLNVNTLSTTKDEKKYVHGIRGIMEIFACSRSKACVIRNDIEGAIIQHGRSIVIDVNKALELAGKKKGGRNY